MGAEDLEQRAHLLGRGEALDGAGDVAGFGGIGAGEGLGALAEAEAEQELALVGERRDGEAGGFGGFGERRRN